jgi:hypothetical protein
MGGGGAMRGGGAGIGGGTGDGGTTGADAPIGGGGSKLAGPPSSGACTGARNGLPVATAAFVSVPFDDGPSSGGGGAPEYSRGLGGGIDGGRSAGGGIGVGDDARIGGGGGGPAEGRPTGARGIGGTGRIEVGCDPAEARPGGGGGVGTGTGAEGHPVLVERPTGGTIPRCEPRAGGAGGKAGGGTTAAESASGGIDQPLPFTRSSKTPRSSPPLPSDIDAAPCSTRDMPDDGGPARRAILPKASAFGQWIFELSKTCQARNGRNSLRSAGSSSVLHVGPDPLSLVARGGHG